MDGLIASMGQHLLCGRVDELKAAVTEALAGGVTPQLCLDKGMMPAMEELGERFSDGEAFLPELLLAGHTMKGALEVLRPAMVKEGVQARGTMVIGTVAGDIHDLGKNIVKMMFEGAGFRVVDLGTSVSAQTFADACKEEGAGLVGISSLLTNTMGSLGGVIQQVRDSVPEVKVIVGGAPLTEAFAQEVGADGFAADAYAAVPVGEGLLGV
jgi:5-methyltetrahydrofolate--homocysteine methyltransferase